MKIRLREITVFDLDSETMVMPNKFVRIARKQGADLRMQHSGIIRSVFSYASETKNPDLIVLSMRISSRMARYIVKSHFKKLSTNVLHTVNDL